MNNLNYKQLEKICKDLPGYEHTVMRSLSDIKESSNCRVTQYKSVGCKITGPIISTQRGENGELEIYSANAHSHCLVIGSTGSGKTQGFVLSQLMNADGQSSMVVVDIKGELYRRTRKHMERVYGKENVRVLNALDPTKSDVFINPLKAYALTWLRAEKLPKAERENARAQVETDLRTLFDLYFPQTDFKNDRSWQDIARQLILAIAIGLLYDLTISDSEVDKTKRKRTTLDDITFAKMREVFESFDMGGYNGTSFNDHGFFSTRKKTSNAYKYSRVALQNAGTTRLNYTGFAADFLNRYADPKIKMLLSNDNFDFSSLAKKPGVLYIMVDFSDDKMRELINKILSSGIKSLLKSDYAKGNSGDNIPVNFIVDEFSTMMPDATYPAVLSTGRGSNLFLTMVVQSLSQLEARYPADLSTMTENCNLQLFVGTNDEKTATRFSEELGKTSIPDPIAFVNGVFQAITVPAVTADYLLHRMKPGEVFIKVHGEQPIHGHYEYYYKTPEYTEDYSVCDDYDSKIGDDFFDCVGDAEYDNEVDEKYIGDDECDVDFDTDDDDFDEFNVFFPNNKDVDEDECEDDEEDEDEEEIEAVDDNGNEHKTEDKIKDTNEETDRFENKCMDEIEKIVLISEKNNRQDAIRISKQKLKRARNPEKIKVLERVVREFEIATDTEYDLLKNQLFS